MSHLPDSADQPVRLRHYAADLGLWLFVLVHVGCFAAIWTGVSLEMVGLAVALYFIRIFGIGAGYHRLFAHRAYKTSRPVQFLLALLAQTAAQGGVQWWAATHRRHHKYSDTPDDKHSPVQRGFVYSHVGWLFDPRHDRTETEEIPDLQKYPELNWLNRNRYSPAIGLGILMFLLFGWEGLVVGFLWSTVAVWHATFCINSLAHVMGSKRYVTGDESRNNWLLALATMGEGWHNNHHAYQASARQGFRWWEIDATFYILKVLSWMGIIWDLRSPPEAVLRNEHRLGAPVLERASRRLAAMFPVEHIADQAHDALVGTPLWADLQERARRTGSHAKEYLATLLPHLPTLAEVQLRAEQEWRRSPSLHEVAARAREVLSELVAARLLARAAMAS